MRAARGLVKLEALHVRKIAKTLLMMLGTAVVLEVLNTALHALVWWSRNPRALHFVKRCNKYVDNRVVLRFAGRSGSSAIVHHVGRRSAMPYATPVLAHQTDSEVIVPLPYGIDVDWLRNLKAAGQAVVDLRGRRLSVEEPAVADIDEVIGLLPASLARTVRFSGARQAVRMRVSETTMPGTGVRSSDRTTEVESALRR